MYTVTSIEGYDNDSSSRGFLGKLPGGGEQREPCATFGTRKLLPIEANRRLSKSLGATRQGNFHVNRSATGSECRRTTSELFLKGSLKLINTTGDKLGKREYHWKYKRSISSYCSYTVVDLFGFIPHACEYCNEPPSSTLSKVKD